MFGMYFIYFLLIPSLQIVLKRNNYRHRPMIFGFKILPLQPLLGHGQVLHGQLPSNPPGRERSKGSWL